MAARVSPQYSHKVGGAEGISRRFVQGGPENGGKDAIVQRLLQGGKQLQVTLQKTKESSRDLSIIDDAMVDVLGQCSQSLQQEKQVRCPLNSNTMT